MRLTFLCYGISLTGIMSYRRRMCKMIKFECSLSPGSDLINGLQSCVISLIPLQDNIFGREHYHHLSFGNPSYFHMFNLSPYDSLTRGKPVHSRIYIFKYYWPLNSRNYDPYVTKWYKKGGKRRTFYHVCANPDIYWMILATDNTL